MPKNRTFRIAADELHTLIPDFDDLRDLEFVAAYERWYEFAFFDRLINNNTIPTDWDAQLTIEQRDAVAAALCLVSKHPEYMHRSSEISVAIKRLVGHR